MNKINSIEKIAIDSLVPDGTDSWVLINVPKTILSHRTFPVVVPLNDTEIVVMGGRSSMNWFGDLVIFDTITNKCQQMFNDTTGMFKYEADDNNQCAQVGVNKIIALVTDKRKVPSII